MRTANAIALCATASLHGQSGTIGHFAPHYPARTSLFAAVSGQIAFTGGSWEQLPRSG
jgi:hypothetical protein